mmetsp:Transcript_73562/g.145803  ORF Transcript_73562/g.145803 Transcript_73562/m.145803 type:complete len:114 (+) Transcript_73562:529-870(+)
MAGGNRRNWDMSMAMSSQFKPTDRSSAGSCTSTHVVKRRVVNPPKVIADTTSDSRPVERLRQFMTTCGAQIAIPKTAFAAYNQAVTNAGTIPRAITKVPTTRAATPDHTRESR